MHEILTFHCITQSLTMVLKNTDNLQIHVYQQLVTHVACSCTVLENENQIYLLLFHNFSFWTPVSIFFQHAQNHTSPSILLSFLLHLSTNKYIYIYINF